MAIDVGSAIAYLDLDTSKFRSGLKSALISLESFADSSLSASSRISALGSAMSTTGSTLTRTVTLPLAAAGTAATTIASNFEASMSKVEAISGSTADQMVDLRNKAIEMGAKTKFSAKESADAFTYMAMAGWKAEQMIDGIGGIMSLAAADGLDLATTSDIVTDALTAFGLKAEDSSHFADVLAQASSAANTNVAMLGESFKYAASVAGSMGVSVEDTALALGIMANSGIKSSMAGTALRSVLTRLATDAGASSEKLGALGVLTQELGVQFYDSEGNVRDFSDVLVETREAWKGLNQEQQTNYAKTIAGQYALSGFLALMNTEEEEFNKLANAIENSDGRADEMAATMMDNLAGAVEQLMGALESLAIKFGTALTPTIRSVAEWLTMLVEKLNTLSDAQVEQIVRIAAIAAAIGPLLLIVGKLITSFVSFVSFLPKLTTIGTTFTRIGGAIGSLVNPITLIRSLFVGLGKVLLAMINPVNLIVMAVGVAIAAFTKLYNENEAFREQVQAVWNGISDGLSSTIETIKETLLTFKDALAIIPEVLNNTFNTNAEEMGSSFIGLFQSIGEAVQKILPIIQLFAEIIGGVLLTAISASIGIVNGLLNALSPLLDIVTSLVNLIGNLGALIVAVFSGDFETAKEVLGQIWEDIEAIFSNAIEAIVAFLSGFVDGFWTTLKSLFNAFGVDVATFFSNIWNSIVEFFTGVKDNIVGFVTNLGESLVNFVTVTIPNFIETIKAHINNLPYYWGYVIGLVLGYLYSFGESLVKWVTEDIPAFIEKIFEYVKTIPDRFTVWLALTIVNVGLWITQLKEKAIEAGTNFVDSITTFFEELPDKFNKWLEDAIDTFSDFIDDMKEAGKDLIDGLWEGLKEAWTSVLEWFEGVGDKISDFFSGIADGFNDAKDSVDTLQGKVSGSHANGLTYVPYNGYVAELHQGERVLTKEEAKEYNSGKSQGNGNTFNFYGTEKLDQRETEAAFERMLREFDLLTT